MSRLFALILLVACGTPRDAVPSNVAPAGGVRIAPDEPLGWLGLAPTPARDDDAPAWLPADPAHAVLVPMPAEGLAPGAVFTAYGSRGSSRVTAGAETKVAFGCEHNQLDVRALDGERLPPGIVWIPPAASPWQPTPQPVTAERATPTARRYAVGPFAIELVRTQPMRGTLEIRHGGRTVFTRPIVRGTEMAGAGAPPIDLAVAGPGVPAPVGAWSLSSSGPYLIAFVEPTWEGQQIFAVLVEGDRARTVEPLSQYLYLCAY